MAPARGESVVLGINAFAHDLYLRLAQADGNHFSAPYKISSALALVCGGPSGTTAEQLAEALRVDGSPEAFHQHITQLTAALNASGEWYDLAMANALWGQTGFPFLPEFLELGRYYEAAGGPLGTAPAGPDQRHLLQGHVIVPIRP